MLDNHGRPIQYLRLAVTDRCNLRCFYCMPEHGIKYLPENELLTYPEMLRLVRVLATMGVSKIRITGGEPFMRKGLMDFLWQLRQIKQLTEISLTTNGVFTAKHVPELKKIGIAAVNLSIDTLNAERFLKITRRNELPQVLETLQELLNHDIPTKINVVVMENQNIEDIFELSEYTKTKKLEVRFIEEMPFNGEGAHYSVLVWTYKKILDELKKHYPDLYKITDAPHSTAYHYQIPTYKGKIGLIAAFSRTFCGTCNRIRITAKGTLKTCLYDNGVADLKTILRHHHSDESLTNALTNAFLHRPKNGFEAQEHRSPITESMASIGG